MLAPAHSPLPEAIRSYDNAGQEVLSSKYDGSARCSAVMKWPYATRWPAQAAEFARAKLWDPETKHLRRSFRLGPSAAQGFADDYAYMIAGLLDLYQVSK